MKIDKQLLYPQDEILLGLMIFLIMLGMGASLTAKDFKAVYRHKRGVLIGFMSQFGLMPLVAFGLSYLFGLSPALAISLILIGCMPGGTTSNMFAYFARGSVALSIAMTTASTLMALVMVPFLLDFYAAGFTRELSETLKAEGREFVIPRGEIISSLVVVLIPVALGMLIRWKSPLWAKTVEDTGGFLGIIVILYLIGTGVIRHSELFLETPWQIYFSTIFLGLLGFLFGYCVARSFLLPPIFRRAISLETGIQNTPAAFAVILLSFTDPVQSQMLWLAILYAMFIVAASSIVTLFYRRVGRFDYEVYQNTRIHNRLFGEDYVTWYPKECMPAKLHEDPSQGTIPAQKRA